MFMHFATPLYCCIKQIFRFLFRLLIILSRLELPDYGNECICTDRVVCPTVSCRATFRCMNSEVILFHSFSIGVIAYLSLFPGLDI